MTPSEREQFERDIYFEIHKPENHGCLTDAADFLRHKDSSRLSRITNPNDPRANNIFGEVSDVLEAFHYKYPQLEEFIWEKLSLRRNQYLKCARDKKAALVEIADRAAREQLDVNLAICRGESQKKLEEEAFQALQKSKAQYDTVCAMGQAVEISESGVQ